ncbi:MAG: peptide chain release factor-like protein [Planctomycetota bacterium]
MTDFGVSAQKMKQLRDKMAKLGIREQDIEESFIRSSGPGGQNVNKTSTCVYLKHLPTGIEVKCQTERSQVLNRYRARQILANKIETLVLGRLSAEQQRIAKIQRQKRKRSKRAKQKMLDAKHKHSEKKQLRSDIRDMD